jgi:uncharacterized membrane protein YedE/YeeE
MSSSKLAPSDQVEEQSNMADPEETTSLKNEPWDVEGERHASTKKLESVVPVKFYLLLLAVGMGTIFGFSLEKGQVIRPDIIVKQFLFEKFIMVKMFLSAVASSLVWLSLLSVLPAARPYWEVARDNFLAGRGVLSVALGAFILGVGMAVSGSCPGSAYVQLGAGLPNAWALILGGFIAVFAFSFVEPMFREKLWPVGRIKKEFLDVLFSTKFAFLALPFALLLVVCVAVLEVAFPYRKELGHPGKADNGGGIFAETAWPPYVAGIFVGLMQIPTVLLLRDTLGSASSYKTMLSSVLYLVASPLVKKSKWLMGVRTGMNNYWQVVYVWGVILGGFLGAFSSDTLSHMEGPGILVSILGGFLIVFGPLMAAGCTTGHGISGLGLMATTSFIAIPFMFGGAIIASFILKAAGAYTFL